ncbi:MAG: glycosyltransferase family 4 protein, partial [Planctomycetota bacterium]
MKILFYLPTVSAYRDRISTLVELSNHIEHLTLLLGRLDAPLPTHDPAHLSVVDAAFRPGARLRNTARAYNLCRTLCRDESITILHDTFGALVPCFFWRSAFPGVTMLTSLYCLNAWRIRHVWGDQPWYRLLANRSTALMFYGRLLERWTCERADGVILQAEGLKARLQEEVHVPTDRLHILPNAVDTDRWAPKASLTPPPPKGPVRLISVGSLGESRGVFVHLETLKACLALGLDAHLTLIGSTEAHDRDRIQSTIKQEDLGNRVALPGRLPEEEVRQHLEQSHLFLYQTQNDGSPRSLLEAMAFGLPVVASSHPGIDALDPGGQTLRLTPYGDVKVIIQSIQSLCEDGERWQRASHDCRRLAVENFDIKPVAERYRKLYHLF